MITFGRLMIVVGASALLIWATMNHARVDAEAQSCCGIVSAYDGDALSSSENANNDQIVNGLCVSDAEVRTCTLKYISRVLYAPYRTINVAPHSFRNVSRPYVTPVTTDNVTRTNYNVLIGNVPDDGEVVYNTASNVIIGTNAGSEMTRGHCVILVGDNIQAPVSQPNNYISIDDEVVITDATAADYAMVREEVERRAVAEYKKLTSETNVTADFRDLPTFKECPVQ